MYSPINEHAAIREFPTPGGGVGLFARHDINPGLRILSESPIFRFQTRAEALQCIVAEFQDLSTVMKHLIMSTYASQNRAGTTPGPNGYDTRDPMVIAQLERMARFNLVDVYSGRYAIALGSSALNHR